MCLFLFAELEKYFFLWYKQGMKEQREISRTYAIVENYLKSVSSRKRIKEMMQTVCNLSMEYLPY
jgi:hypothetical protein